MSPLEHPNRISARWENFLRIDTGRVVFLPDSLVFRGPLTTISYGKYQIDLPKDRTEDGAWIIPLSKLPTQFRLRTASIQLGDEELPRIEVQQFSHFDRDFVAGWSWDERRRNRRVVVPNVQN